MTMHNERGPGNPRQDAPGMHRHPAPRGSRRPGDRRAEIIGEADRTRAVQDALERMKRRVGLAPD